MSYRGLCHIMSKMNFLHLYFVYITLMLCWQIAHDSYYLYVFAPDNDCRLKWVNALKEGGQLLQKVIPKERSVFITEWNI